MNKKTNILIIIVVFFIALGGISTLLYTNLKNNKTIEVEATVKMVGDNYIIAEDIDGNEYSLQTNDKYNIGDRIDFLIKNTKTKNKYIEGTVLKIDTISEKINFSIIDNNNDTKNELDTNSSNDNQIIGNELDTNSSNDKQSSNSEVITEDDIISYFTNLNDKLDTYEQDKSIGQNLKEGFVTVVDFLFYDGQIKGKTFNELSATAKIKVLQIAFSIDKKIEQHFPGYKETITTKSKDAYANVKTKATELYLDITTEVCKENSNLCESAKQGLSDMKDSFSLTWDFIKEASNKGLIKLKEWYEIWKNC